MKKQQSQTAFKKPIVILMMILFVLFFTAFKGLETPTPGVSEQIWVPVFEDMGQLPVGDATEPGFSVRRELRDGRYTWMMQSADGKYNVVLLPNLLVPSGYQVRIDLQVQMPAFDPYGCAGIVFAQHDNAFHDFLVCSDRTYALYRNTGGDWTSLIPFTPFTLVDPGDVIPVSILIREGWADFSIAGEVLDTFHIGSAQGMVGLFGQPLSGRATQIDYMNVSVSVSPDKGGAVAQSENVPDSVARSLRMLSLKGRISHSNGTAIPIENDTLTLANIGNFFIKLFNQPAQDVLLQGTIDYQSAYEKPDFPKAGCGFTIRAVDNWNFVQVMLSLDGTVYLRGYRNGVEIPIAAYHYGNWTLKGKADLALIAEGAKITVMADGRVLGTVEDATWMRTGDAGLTVYSGTNFDYGQSCEFSDLTYFQFSTAPTP